MLLRSREVNYIVNRELPQRVMEVCAALFMGEAFFCTDGFLLNCRYIYILSARVCNDVSLSAMRYIALRFTAKLFFKLNKRITATVSRIYSSAGVWPPSKQRSGSPLFNRQSPSGDLRSLFDALTRLSLALNICIKILLRESHLLPMRIANFRNTHTVVYNLN